MRITRPTLTVTAVIAVAALLAACSSADTKNDYVDTVNGIQTSALDAFNQAANSTPKNKMAMVEQLEAVEVPEEAEEGHPELVSGIDALRALFEQTATDVQKAEGADAFSAVTALASEGAVIGTEIDQAITQINEDLGAE